jgi:hypothetical protein
MVKLQGPPNHRRLTSAKSGINEKIEFFECARRQPDLENVVDARSSFDRKAGFAAECREIYIFLPSECVISKHQAKPTICPLELIIS